MTNAVSNSVISFIDTQFYLWGILRDLSNLTLTLIRHQFTSDQINWQISKRPKNMTETAPPADLDKMLTPYGSRLIEVPVEILLSLATKVQHNEQVHALKTSANHFSSSITKILVRSAKPASFSAICARLSSSNLSIFRSLLLGITPPIRI